MNIYDKLSTEVYKTLKQYGQAVKITSVSGSSITTYGVWGESKKEDVDEQMVGNIAIKKKVLYIPYIKTAPEVGGTITVNKVVYSINKVDEYQPTDKAVGFKIEVIV